MGKIKRAKHNGYSKGQEILATLLNLIFKKNKNENHYKNIPHTHQGD